MFTVEAANIDPEDFTWLVFSRTVSYRSKTSYNQRHTLKLNKGDVFGVRFTQKKTYQFVKASEMHILYKGIDKGTHDRILKNSIVSRTTPTKTEIEEGFFRAQKVSTKEPVTSLRMKSFYYQPQKEFGKIQEKTSINLEHYQWRKLGAQAIKIITKKAGKARFILKPNSVFGMRFQRTSTGGFILYEDEQPINISVELYTEIIHGSKILPYSAQREGIIDKETGVLSNIKVDSKVKRRRKPREVKEEENSRPPIIEEPISKKYDWGDLDEDAVSLQVKRRKTRANQLSNTLKRLLAVPKTETFDPDVDDEEFDPEDETVEEVNETVEEDDTLVSDVLEPGVLIKMLKGNERKYVIVQASHMETNDKLMEYYLFAYEEDSADAADFVLYKLRLKTTTTMFDVSARMTVMEEEYDEKRLTKLESKINSATFKNLPLVK